VTHPCRSPYCECEAGKCTHPGFHDARHLSMSPTAPNYEWSDFENVISLRVNGEEIIATYDEHGSAGMALVRQIANALARSESHAPVAIPERKTHAPMYPDESREDQYAAGRYVSGWNDCHAAFTAALAARSIEAQAEPATTLLESHLNYTSQVLGHRRNAE
jgi:hypothetical protein